MADFFNDLKRDLKVMSAGVSQQTKTLADITRLNAMIADEEKKIQKEYSEIGKAYFIRHAEDSSSIDWERVCAIKASKERIEQCQEQLKALKEPAKPEGAVCPRCGRISSPEFMFCKECGAKLSVPDIKEEVPFEDRTLTKEQFLKGQQSVQQNEIHTDLNQKKVCERCGAEILDEFLFCMNCGAPVAKQSGKRITHVSMGQDPDDMTMMLDRKPKKIYCPNCHGEVEPDDLFCTVCGTRIWR